VTGAEENRLTWPALRDAIDRGQIPLVSTLVLAGTEEQRRAVCDDLEAYARSLSSERGSGWGGPGPAPAVAVAALGCLPTAARAAALLGRRNLREQWPEIPVTQLLAVARVRNLPWLGDLALRLAGKLDRAGNEGEWTLIAALLTEAGVAPPTDDAFVRGWVAHLQARHPDREPVRLLDRLRTDAYLDALLPRIFTVDGLGSDLGRGSSDPDQRQSDQRPAFPYALVALAAEGRIDRGLLLDGVLERFLRGDRAAALRAFVLLHDELAPTEAELTQRVTRYVKLLPAAPSTVAALAQRALRQVDDAGGLELTSLLSASNQLLLRPEKGLLKAQLGWLDRVAKRDRDRLGEVLETIAGAFGHDAIDIQERALTIVLRHVGRIEPTVRGRLAERAAQLAGDLPARAAAVLGGPAVVAPVVVPVGSPLLPPPAAALPPPVGSAAELAEEIVALLHEHGSMAGWERVLAGLVMLRASTPEQLRDALTPILDRYGVQVLAEQPWGGPRLPQLLGEVIRAAAGVRIELSGSQRGMGLLREALGVAPAGMPATAMSAAGMSAAGMPAAGYGPGPLRVLALRVAEIAVWSRHAPVPTLIATPTRANGQLDAAVLVDRLAAAERAGWQPWRFDLEQALLRLPREVDGDALSRASVLRSPAGVRLAGWLADGGPADPVSVRVEQRRPAPTPLTRWQLTYLPERRVVVRLRPVGAARGPLDEHLFQVSPPDRPAIEYSEAETRLWAAVLPNHREVVAAWALPTFAGLADYEQRGAELLPLLAEAAGRVGPAMTLALAYALAARHESDRGAAVDAFLTLAGGGELDCAALGREIGALTADGTVKLTRVVAGLAEAARAGAHGAVWAVIESALPVVLGTAPRGLPDLLALGARTATRAGCRAPLAELAAVVGRGGASRLVTEARRLDRVLTG
jgi:hypothetical protein